MGEIGVKYPCFGEYKCPECNRFWESSKAWRDYGQKCKHCSIDVSATGLEALFHYVCQSCYKTTNGKEGHWKYKMCKDGRKCRSCKEYVKPFLTYSEFKEFKAANKLWVEQGLDHIDPAKSHKEKLCEKCVKLGRLCYQLGIPNKPTMPVSRENNDPDSAQTDRKAYTNSYKLNVPKNKSSERVDSNASFTSTYTGDLVASGLSYRTVARIGVPSLNENNARETRTPGRSNTQRKINNSGSTISSTNRTRTARSNESQEGVSYFYQDESYRTTSMSSSRNEHANVSGFNTQRMRRRVESQFDPRVLFGILFFVIFCFLIIPFLQSLENKHKLK